MVTIFTFDRDQTVDVNEGPVPLTWVRHLAHEAGYTVYCHGNPRLTDEANIPYTPNRGGRGARVRSILTEHPDATRVIAVDDMDVSGVAAEEEVVEYYEPDAFVNRFQGSFGLPPPEG